MASFDVLSEGIAYSGIKLGGALKYGFFSECLRSQLYRTQSWPRAFLSSLGASSWKVKGSRGHVVFVREGKNSRDAAQTYAVQQSLESRGVAVGYLLMDRPATWRDILATLTRHPFLLLACLSRPRMRGVARLLQAEFGLTKAVRPWLLAQVMNAKGRLAAVLAYLRSLTDLPLVMVVSSEHHPISFVFVSAASQLGIPVVLMQHGFLGQAWLHWPLVAKRVCVWGEVDRAWYLERGAAPEQIIATGTPRPSPAPAATRMALRERFGLQPSEKAVVFFTPNLADEYHSRASRFVREAARLVETPCRWFVRSHPAQGWPRRVASYDGCTHLPPEFSFQEILSLADVALHDFSTMAEAEYSGVMTICLSLDPPYPDYYRNLVGRQPVVNSVEDLRRLIDKVAVTPVHCVRPTEALAAVGPDAAERIAHVVTSLL